jgi:hypothetical protein
MAFLCCENISTPNRARARTHSRTHRHTTPLNGFKYSTLNMRSLISLLKKTTINSDYGSFKQAGLCKTQVLKCTAS